MSGSADDDYVRNSFRPIAGVCRGRLPDVRAAVEAGEMARPTYVLADGSEWVPSDYLQLVDDAGSLADLRAHVEGRYVVAADTYGAVAGPDELDDAWYAFLDGVWHARLVEGTPENAVREVRLAAAIERLLDAPAPDDWRWANRLRARVEHLAVLTRSGTASDRERNGGPLPRDIYVTDVMASHPAAFSSSHEE